MGCKEFISLLSNFVPIRGTRYQWYQAEIHTFNVCMPGYTPNRDGDSCAILRIGGAEIEATPVGTVTPIYERRS